ncbi:mycothiol transferase [Glutamicibacter sp. 287]
MRWSLLHIGSEASQHAGHPDIIRESSDGAKSMG